MTLDEAINELRQDTQHPTAQYMPKLRKAQQLGIEALELVGRIQDMTRRGIVPDWSKGKDKLPSEGEK